MSKRGRVSAAALEVTPVSRIETVQRQRAPHDLTDEETEVWVAVVNDQAADWFSPSTVPVLAAYCRAVIQARRVAEWMERATCDPDLTFSDYAKILHQQREQHASVASLATKMRISQQALTNHRGNKKPNASRKPWEG